MTMKKLCYILVLFILASCNRKSQDTDIFNGKITSIEDHAPEKEVEFKELTLKGLNFGFLAMHDSLAFFMNPKLQTKWFQLFNCHTLDEVGEFVGKLQRLADHAVHETEDMKPASPQTEKFQVTDEICEEAFRAGLAAKDFSIGFLQRRFLIGFGTAVKLRDKLLFDKKITRAFLAGDVLCKG